MEFFGSGRMIERVTRIIENTFWTLSMTDWSDRRTSIIFYIFMNVRGKENSEHTYLIFLINLLNFYADYTKTDSKIPFSRHSRRW